MAISGYRPNRIKTIIYYAAIAIIIIMTVFFLYYIASKKKSDEEPANGPQTAQKAFLKQPSSTSPSQTKVVADVNTAMNPRVAILFKDAQDCISGGKIITARNTLNDILNMSSDTSVRETVKKQLNGLAQDWLFSRTIYIGDDLCSSYKVQSGELLSQIAAKFKVPYQFLMKINNISNERSLRADQVIKVVHGPFHAILYSSSFTMDLYLQNIYVKTYMVGLGKEGHETPVGLWKAKIGGKMIKPTWTDPDTGKTYHADDPDYPLGSGWIALDGIDNRTRGITGIAIHGTNDESSIGTKSSRGCIRLYNGELIELYDMFEPGNSELRIVE